MPDTHDKFDLSDSAESEVPKVTPEKEGSFAELEAQALQEGLEALTAKLDRMIGEDTAESAQEATEMGQSIEKRYQDNFTEEDSAELQELLERGESLRAATQAKIESVVNDEPGAPTLEDVKKETSLRSERAELDAQWERLSKVVASEGARESERMAYALRSGKSVPESDAGRRLNEVWKRIQEIDTQLASMPKPAQAEAPKAAPIYPEAFPEGSDENPLVLTKKMEKQPKEKPLPPPPPGSEGRAAWLKMRADAETDPAKKQEWALKYLEEIHGPAEKPAEAERVQAPETAAESQEASAAPEGNAPEAPNQPQGNTPEMWQNLYPDADFTEDEAPEQTEEAMETPPKAVEAETPKAPPKKETAGPAEPAKEEPFVAPDPMEVLLTPRKKGEGAGPKEDLPTEPAEESLPEIAEEMQEEVAAVLSGEPEPTHSERHDGNAEKFTELNRDLPDMLDTIAAKGDGFDEGLDLRTIKSPKDLFRAMTNAGLLTKEEGMALSADKARANALFNVVFAKEMKKRNKKTGKKKR